MLGSHRTFLRTAPYPRPLQARLRWWQRTVARWARLLPLAWLAGLAGWSVIICGVVGMAVAAVDARSELGAAANVTLAGGLSGVVTFALGLVQRRQKAPKADAAVQLGLWQLAAFLLVIALAGVLSYPGT